MLVLGGMFVCPALAKRLYSQPFPLVDITVIPDDEIMQHRRIAVLELLQKLALMIINASRYISEVLQSDYQ